MKKILMIAGLLLPSMALAAPDVSVEITAEKVVFVEKNGKQVESLVAAQDVLPGDVLVYTLSYVNKGNKDALNIELVDPIPESTVFIADSAFGPGASVLFSIDQGKTFKKPSLLSYEVDVAGKKVKRSASPEEYTHIRWIVEKVAPNKSGVAGFRARVK